MQVPKVIIKSRDKIDTEQRQAYWDRRREWFEKTGYVYWDNYFTEDGVSIGEHVGIAPGVKIISRNHDIYDIWKRGELRPVVIEDYCWIGSNAVILPGVHLGKHTIVGAGSVVTKSFTCGYCIIAGNPAKIIKMLDEYKCKEKQP